MHFVYASFTGWTASSEFGAYRLCEQRRFRRACASAQSHQNLRCSFIQAVRQEEPSDRKPDPRPLWVAGHAQLKFVMTECSKTQIRLTGLRLVTFRRTAGNVNYWLLAWNFNLNQSFSIIAVKRFNICFHSKIAICHRTNTNRTPCA